MSLTLFECHETLLQVNIQWGRREKGRNLKFAGMVSLKSINPKVIANNFFEEGFNKIINAQATINFNDQ